jgi:hypothetical protein
MSDQGHDAGKQSPDQRQAMGGSLVQGVARTVVGIASRGLLVTAFDQDLRTRQELGRSRTDANGEYRIAYGPDQYRRGELRGADLVLEVSTPDGEVLYTSDIRFNAPARLVVDVTLTKRSSEAEFDRILREMKLLVEGQGVELHELEEKKEPRDLTFAARETGIPRDLLLDFAIAQRLPARTELPPEFWHAVLRTEALRSDSASLLRINGVADKADGVMAAIPGTAPPTIETGLKKAINDNIIARRYEEQIPAWLRQYRALRAREAGRAEGRHNPAPVVDATGLTGKKRAAFLEIYVEAESRADLRKRLQESKAFTKLDLAAIGTALTLHDLTLGNIKVLESLRMQLLRPQDVRQVARLSRRDWEGLIEESGEKAPDSVPGESAAEKRAGYAALLRRRAELGFPTAAFAGDLKRALNSRQKPAVGPDVLRFLDTHPAFELATMSVDGFIKGEAQPRFFNAPIKPDVVQQLKAVQRVYKVAPSFDAANTLLADGIHSAQQIYRLGESQFVERYKGRPGFSEQSARDAFNRAANTHGAVITMVGDFRATDNADAVAALRNRPRSLKDVPNLTTLFGSADSCACEHCRSIFSPSAYFADLMKYLEARNVAPAGTAAGVLLKRRPDISYLNLNCENSDTPIPMIDLACEVLEDQVAPWKLFDLPAGTPLAEGPVAAVLSNAFAASTAAVSLSAGATLTGPDVLGSWVVRDGDVCYRIDGNLTVSRPRQTRGTAEELEATPEYVNDAAYKKLGQATYPLTLPFDLSTEEVREYLKRVEVRRWDVMEVFRGNNSPNNPSDLDIACEYLGIAKDEQDLIFKADAGNQERYWGEMTAAASLAAVSAVEVFLHRTRLEYADLQRLLSLAFINPGGTIRIVPTNASCDVASKRLQGLDLKALDRIHRFLRLWRKLGWKMWEVDLAIRTDGLGHDAIGQQLARNLFYALQLKARKPALTTDQLCALFGVINTTPAFTEPYRKPEPSLYERLFLNKRLSNPIDQALTPPLAAGAIQIDAHIPPIVAALRVSNADLVILRGLTNPVTHAAYINGDLTVENLSFLYRHAALARAMQIKIPDWKTLLFLTQQADVFANPKTTLEFVKLLERMKTAKFSVDQLNYVLAGDTAAKGAATERMAGTVLDGLRKTLHAIAVANDKASAPTAEDALATTLLAQLQTLGWDSISAAAVVDLLNDRLVFRRPVPSLPAILPFPAAVLKATAISFETAKNNVVFTGFMTDLQKATLLAVSPAADYQAAITDIHETQRLLIKFFRPRFVAPLDALPPRIAFTAQIPKELATRISYDTERHELVFFGAMTNAERDALKALAPPPALGPAPPSDADYQSAIQILFNASRVPSAEWLTQADLMFPLAPAPSADPALPATKNAALNLATNLAKAEGLLLDFLKRELSEEAVFQQLGTSVRLTPAVTETLVRSYPLFGSTPRSILAGVMDDAFVSSNATITLAAFTEQCEAFLWLHRVALMLNSLKIGFVDLGWVMRTGGNTQVLDAGTLPVTFNPLKPGASIGKLLNLAEFMALHHRYSTADVTILDLVETLSKAAPPGNSSFAKNLETLFEWAASDIKTLTDPNVLDIAYPAAYQEAKSWQRLVKAMTMIQRLNGSADRLLGLAGPTVSAIDSSAVKKMLRSKYEESPWLTLSKEVQDVLRQRKRDSLVSYLLTQPKPNDAPTGKWTNSNDLFAYYLIDVEMCPCQPSSRIVQASAAVQMFVQRCLMGLEPNAVANEKDEGWRQWTWMRQYRVWEANRRVFAYPENYAVPELRRDKSEIFQKLEDELRQKDVTADAMETAFQHYIEGLHEIAQLDVAGSWYQESRDRLHVIGRTAGSDPRAFYHREMIHGDRWTPWAKIDCDIKSPYVVPFTVNERLHLVWPEFRDHPQETQPTPQIPKLNDDRPTDVQIAKPVKAVDVYLSLTERRHDRWTHKRVADSAILNASDPRLLGDQSVFSILPLDFTWIARAPFLLMTESAHIEAVLEFAGCRGYPELWDTDTGFTPELAPKRAFFDRDQAALKWMKNVEQTQGDPLIATGQIDPQGTILGLTPGQFRITYPQYLTFIDQLRFKPMLTAFRDEFLVPGPELPVTLGSFADWFYADKTRTFFIRPKLVLEAAHIDVFEPDTPPVKQFYREYVASLKQSMDLVVISGGDLLASITGLLSSEQNAKLVFAPFYHPFTCSFTKALALGGIPALMAREVQFPPTGFKFATTYQPTNLVEKPYPVEDVDFKRDGSYSSYNWELFFHAPLMVATRLSKNQRFEEAIRWFHYIFDPTGAHDHDPVSGGVAPSPQRYWITKPFYVRQQTGPHSYLEDRIENLMSLLANNPSSPPPAETLAELQEQVREWRANPFDPHLVAQFRTVAYQKLTVMAYIDNLIAWGDQQFRINTMESVNLATQLYVVAAELLGDPPRKIPPATKPPVECFSELDRKLDAFSNAFIEVENLIPVMPSGVESFEPPPPPMPHILYFCIPQNDKLLRYWTTVADRLYKIRHCLDITGVFSPRSLFAPPIDPALLVRANAAGLDLSTALADLDAPLPHYRFATMVQKANEITADVKALGAALLAALEKQDGEALARLRQGHESAVLDAVREIRKMQLDDAQLVIDGLEKNIETVTLRRDYYQSREFVSPGEAAAIGRSTGALLLDIGIAAGYGLSGGLHAIPQFIVGVAGFGASPTGHVKTGGDSFGKVAEKAVQTLSAVATGLEKSAALTSTLAGYQRRAEDWQFQAALASKELEQLGKQLASANLRQALAQKELDNHDLQIANAKEVDEFMRSKYTNKELYEWMVGEVSQSYFQSYQLAFDVAKQAERCFRHEVGVEESALIQFGYWDSLKNGLQSGERLQLDLRRLEAAYLAQNGREFECTKHVSLAILSPEDLLALKDQGFCTLELPEELFDLDYPGHYFRRIKSVSISIPCVAGPHTMVNCTLRLSKNALRINTDLAPQYARVTDGDDLRFRESHVRAKAIATSSGVNDAGLFEFNYLDQRYFPFEGAGVISTWQIELTRERELRQFDYSTIADVILHVRYTAREDAGEFRKSAVDHLLTEILPGTVTDLPLMRLFDLRHEFPTEWYALFHPPAGGPHVLELKIKKRHFPFFAQERIIKIETVRIVARTNDNTPLTVQLDVGSGPANQITLPPAKAGESAIFQANSSPNLGSITLDETKPWKMQLTKTPSNFATLTESEIPDCYLVVEYTLG